MREAQERSSSDCPIQDRVREAQLWQGIDPSRSLRRGCFHMHSELAQRDVYVTAYGVGYYLHPCFMDVLPVYGFRPAVLGQMWGHNIIYFEIEF